MADKTNAIDVHAKFLLVIMHGKYLQIKEQGKACLFFFVLIVFFMCFSHAFCLSLKWGLSIYQICTISDIKSFF